MSKTIEPEQLDAIVLMLVNTCDDLDSVVKKVCDDSYDESDLTMSQLLEIDSQVFKCEECEWWCEISEQNNKDGLMLCADCFESAKDENN